LECNTAYSELNSALALERERIAECDKAIATAVAGADALSKRIAEVSFLCVCFFLLAAHANAHTYCSGCKCTHALTREHTSQMPARFNAAHLPSSTIYASLLVLFFSLG
jgi:hypothetical protein